MKIGERNKAIQELLDKAKKDRAYHQKKLNEANGVISFLSENLKAWSGAKNAEESAITEILSNRFENVTAPVAAETILRENGKPMHINDVITEILENGYREQTNRRKLYGNLYSRFSRKKVFVNRADGKPGFVALAEWSKKDSDGNLFDRTDGRGDADATE